MKLLPATPPNKMSLDAHRCIVAAHRVANKNPTPMTDDAICGTIIFQSSRMISTPSRLDLHCAYPCCRDPSSVLFTVCEMCAPASLDALNRDSFQVFGTLHLWLATLRNNKVTIIGLLKCCWSLLPQREPGSSHPGKSTVGPAIRQLLADCATRTTRMLVESSLKIDRVKQCVTGTGVSAACHRPGCCLRRDRCSRGRHSTNRICRGRGRRRGSLRRRCGWWCWVLRILKCILNS
mmetsp:Transcript_32281/g.70658  ORF Transcript_32281/g.70658 Transcript_32281/m.70658 type:complete len:235 (+) Transcript_32281:1436-2140(+)